MKRFVVIFLFIVTILSALGAVYIGIRLSQQPTTPDDAVAAPESCDFFGPGYNCYCIEGNKCCDGNSGEECGYCSSDCYFRNYNNFLLHAEPGKSLLCNYEDSGDGISLTSNLCPPCNCPEPPLMEGWKLICWGDSYCGDCPSVGEGNYWEEKYWGKCDGCEQPYVCYKCYQRETTVTDTPPVTTPVVTTPVVTTPVVTTPVVTTPIVTTPVVTTPVVTTPVVTTPVVTTPVVTTPVVTTSITITDTLPPTAVFTDEIDRMLLGLISIFVGLLIFKSGLYKDFGKLLAEWYGNLKVTKK